MVHNNISFESGNYHLLIFTQTLILSIDLKLIVTSNKEEFILKILQTPVNKH